MLLSGKVPGEAKMPSQMEGGQAGSGGGYLHTAMQTLAPDPTRAPYPASHPFLKRLCRPLWFLPARTPAYPAFSAMAMSGAVLPLRAKPRLGLLNPPATQAAPQGAGEGAKRCLRSPPLPISSPPPG